MRTILLIFLIVVYITTSNAIDITSCMNITSSGRYTLTTDITNHVGSCLVINVSDVFLNCSGHRLDGDDVKQTIGNVIADFGIAVSTEQTFVRGSEIQNVTITNCNVSDFVYGIFLNNATDVLITESESDSNLDYGVYPYFSNSITLNDIKSYDNGLVNINVEDSHNIIIDTLYSSTTDNDVLEIYTSSNITVCNSNLSNSYVGIYIQDSNLTVKDSLVYNNTHADFELWDVGNNNDTNIFLINVTTCAETFLFDTSAPKIFRYWYLPISVNVPATVQLYNKSGNLRKTDSFRSKILTVLDTIYSQAINITHSPFRLSLSSPGYANKKILNITLTKTRDGCVVNRDLLIITLDKCVNIGDFPRIRMWDVNISKKESVSEEVEQVPTTTVPPVALIAVALFVAWFFFIRE